MLTVPYIIIIEIIITFGDSTKFRNKFLFIKIEVKN